MNDQVLEMRNICKDFPGVRALDGVNFCVNRGEVHALVGENGAGKSTLMKILGGVYTAGTYDGEILLSGKVGCFNSIKESERAGIAVIYQELALVRQMNVMENIFLGNELNSGGILNRERMIRETEEILKSVRLDVDPETPVISLGVGKQQLVEIARALRKKASILVLDEPTAALTDSEADVLFGLLKELRSKGTSCIFISHRLKEVFEISDSITILRDGKTVHSAKKEDLNEKTLITHMVGREMKNLFPEQKRSPGEVLFEVKDWSVLDPETGKIACDRINFTLRKGEILGIAGLMGAGRTELAMSLFGAWGKKLSGTVLLDGKEVKVKDPLSAIKQGISLLSEDRKRYGLVLMMDIKKNITLASLDSISPLSVIGQNEEIRVSEKYVSELRVKTPSIEQKAGNLSGGNQQKVVIAKWLMAGPKVLILDEPTRGIDVNAKSEILSIINRLAESGAGIIMISSELPEVLGMSDRILVMHEGKIAKELPGKGMDQETVMRYATGSEC